MNKNKKSRPGDCSTRTATETGTTCETASSPAFYDTMFRAGGQTGISSLLMHGADHALPLRQLKQMTGLPGRDLRRQIQRERLADAPILSDNISGYFLPANDLERQQFVQSMRCRAKEIQAVAAAVEAGTSERGRGEMSEISPPSEG